MCLNSVVCGESPHVTLSISTIVRLTITVSWAVYTHGYTWLLIWAVSDSACLPGRSQSFSPKCLSLQATDWPSPLQKNTHTHTHSDCCGPSVPWPHCIPLSLCQVDSVTVVFPPSLCFHFLPSVAATAMKWQRPVCLMIGISGMIWLSARLCLALDLT